MKKRFGQHLLTDKNYLRKIIASCDLKKEDTVLEIGAGTGLLTVLLAKLVKKVFAVEIERDVLRKLKENTKQFRNIEIIEKDFLKIDLQVLKTLKIAGNIPYNLTSKILLKLFGEIDKPASHLKNLDKVYLMLQLEVAKRICAKPDTKEYSPLTLLVQFFSEPKILFTVPSSVFHPPPKVESAFVEFMVKKNLPELKNPTFLKNLIRIGFQQRRKKLINSLERLIGDKKKVASVFDRLNLDHNLRAENIDFKTYQLLSSNL